MRVVSVIMLQSPESGLDISKTFHICGGSCRYRSIRDVLSHISLPQTSVSVDSWVEKEKSKNYHNWTSSASHDVCEAPIFTYIMSGCGLIYEKWMCVKSEWRDMKAELCVKRTIPPCFAPWFNWIFSITLCRNTDKYKLQAVLHTMRNALEVWLW